MRPMVDGASSNEPVGVLIVGNPYSGKRSNRRYVERLVIALQKRGLEPRTIWDRDERAAVLGDPGLAESVRCVVSAGGDGSLADVINDLSPAAVNEVPLAMLPMGNENLFARQFGFTRCFESLADAIVRCQTRPIDAAEVDDKLFTLMASSGFDAEVVHRVASWRQQGAGLRRVNRLSYLPRILKAVFGYKYPRIMLEADGLEITGCHVFVFNLPQYGGHLSIAPQAQVDDGRLDWLVFERPGLGALLGYLWSVVRGRHLGRRDVLYGQARELKITAAASAPVQADGDPVGVTPVTIRIQPAAFRVIVVNNC